MTNAILKYLIAFLVTAVTVKALSRPAIRIGLVDRPGGRKRHDAPVPLIGGPAMFAGFVFGALTLLESLYVYRVLFVSMALLVVVGVLDDARDLKPSSKSVAQLVAALFMTSWAGLFVMQLGNLFGFVVLDLRHWAIPFTVVCVLGVINAINMADGLDGLAGGLVLVALGFLCAGAVDVGNLGAAKLLALMAASVAGFLLFNIRLPWQPRARAFMGDSGSMMLGFLLVWFCVELTQTSSPRLEPMSVVWFLAVPLLDMGFVILRRVDEGKEPVRRGPHPSAPHPAGRRLYAWADHLDPDSARHRVRRGRLGRLAAGMARLRDVLCVHSGVCSRRADRTAGVAPGSPGQAAEGQPASGMSAVVPAGISYRVRLEAGRIARWSAIALGFSVITSTALNGVLMAVLLLAWLASGGWGEKLRRIREQRSGAGRARS